MWRANLLEKTLMLGKIEGRRRRGRQRMRWLADIIDSVDMSLSKLQDMVEVREAWHAMVHRVTKSQTWLSDWTKKETQNSLNVAVLFPPTGMLLQSLLRKLLFMLQCSGSHGHLIRKDPPPPQLASLSLLLFHPLLILSHRMVLRIPSLHFTHWTLVLLGCPPHFTVSSSR